MKPPKRFALSTLLLLMLVVAVMFGYAQWRRLGLIAEVERLNEIGAVPVQQLNTRLNARSMTELHVKGGFWPSAYPKIVTMRGYMDAGGRYNFGGKSRSPSDTKEFLQTLEHRLRATGIMMVSVVHLKSESLLETHSIRRIVEDDIDVYSLK